MAWSPEISQLSTDVTQLTDAVNVKKNQLSGAVTSAQTSKASANTSATVAESGAVLSTASMQTANTHKNSTLSIYGTQVAQQASVGTATSHAANAATSLATLAATLTQDLSGVTAQALHRSPNAVTSMFVYDTSKDSDGGAWTEKCQHTSWYNESISGKWLGPRPSELEARYEGATLGAELVTNGNFSGGTTTNWVITGGDVTVADGRLRMFNSAGSRPVITQSFPTVVGKSYKVTFSAEVFSGGLINCRILRADASTDIIAPNTGVGIFTALDTTTVFYMRSNNTTVGSGLFIDNISVKEVTALTTTSNDYFQLTTDGKFYRLWKNLLSNTELFTAAPAWQIGSNITRAAGYADPFGTMKAAQITAVTSGTTTSNYIRQFTALNIYSSGTSSVWVRRVTGTGVVKILSLANGTTGLNITAAISSSWTRVEFAGDAAGGYLYFGVGVETAGDVIEIAFPQLELGAIATTYEAKENVYGNSEVFRGNKRDFPRLAAVVNEVNGITIYDLTEPGRPMWKVFRTHNFTLASSYEYTLHVSRGTLASASASSGLVCVGSTNLGGGNPTNGGGLHVFDFPLDRIYSRVGFYGGDTGRMITMNQYSTVDSSTAAYRHNLPGIASIAVNAVAMTVLPDAPTDPAIGLRVPTIAVGTGSGVSIIRHDGIVRNSSFTNSVFFIYIDKGIVMFSRTGSRGVYFAINPGSLGASWNPSIMGGDPDQYQNNNPVIEKFFSRSSITRFDTISVYRKMNNEVTPARGLNSLIQSRFNTGWMPGDIRRTYLSDVDTGSVAGTELITNGTFTTNLTGWTTLGTAVAEIVSGEVRVSGPNTYALFQQAITVIPGRDYLVTCKARRGTTSEAWLTIGSASNSGGNIDYINSTSTSTVTLIRKIRPTVSTIYISVGTGPVVGDAFFDDVSVREYISDRSYKASTASISGTLTKSQLSSGTSLVGYSGFSSTNYLQEPYSADLDFGTGEFGASAWVNIPVTMPVGNFPVVGGELVTNGTFDVDLSGWTNTNFTWVNGKAVSTTGINSNLSQTLAVTIGKTYKVTATYSAASGGSTLRVSFLGDVVDITTSVTKIVTATTTSIGVTAYGSPVTYQGAIDNISVVEVSHTPIASRAHSSGSNILLGINGTGKLIVTVFDGTTTRTTTTTAAYNTAQWLKAEVCYTTDGSLAIRVNGREVAVTRGTPLLSLNSRRNLILYSEQFNVTTNGWTTSAASIGASVTAPNGTETAQTLAESAVGSIWHGVSQQWGAPVVATVTYSIYAKASTRRYAYLQLGDGSSPRKRYSALFDLESGTFVSANGLNSPTGTNYQISSAGNGWYRLSVTMTLTGLTSGVFTSIGISNTATPTWSSVNYVDYTGDGTSAILIWGAQIELGSTTTNYQRVGIATDFDFKAPLTIGNSFATDAPFPGSIALLKLGATVPTPEQSVFMYEQEKQLFRPGALSVLPDANAIVDMSYDDATDRWAAVSTTNESYWNGLVRSSVTPVPAGSYSKVATTSGVELISRITTNPGVDVSIPPYALREEIVKKSEAASRLSRKTVTYDYTGGFTGNITIGSTSILSVAGLVYPTSYIGARISGTGIPANTTITGVSGTTIYISAPATATTSTLAITFLDFNLPVGMEAKVVLTAGVIKREGSTSDYTRLFDGFIETIRFAVAPGSTAWVQIQATRTTQ